MSEIKNYVEIHFDIDFISVDGDSIVDCSELTVDSMLNPPSKKEKIQTIVWDVEAKDYGAKGTLLFSEPINDDGSNFISFDETKYNDWVQPFVNVWQAEKDRLEQEQQEAQEEYNKFENRQARALIQLNADFETVKQRAHIVSSLGFTADANQTANENVTGLLVTIGDTETVQFCDYHNIFRELTKANLQVLQTEIIANAQNLYQQKWVYRNQIEQCGNNEQLDNVLEGIEFTYMDFTPTGDSETGEQA